MTGAESCAVDLALAPHSPAMWRRRALLAGLILLLLSACIFQILPSPNSMAVERAAPLAEYFPTAIDGWSGEDRPLGETESVSTTAKRILDFDEAFQRVYRKKGHSFILYVAYWKAGKVPARDVAFHIPDQCWVGVGWKRTATNYRYQPLFEGRLLAPAQYREFDAPGDHENVIYWHILDGKTIVYSADGPPSQLATLKSLIRHGMTHKGEQYFIRLSSETPLEQLWTDEGFQAIMELISPLGPGLVSEAEPY